MEKYKLDAPDVASQTVYFSDHPVAQISQRILFKATFTVVGSAWIFKVIPYFLTYFLILIVWKSSTPHLLLPVGQSG
jgi:hypothetical protein